ncbi:MAG TPA: VOC family protein [Sphingomonas sp.]|nr:VOC family protein [Sphingomonas sp.]
MIRPAVIPVLRYADAPAAIDFLCRAFGFEKHAIHADPADPGLIVHAELIREGNMVMLASAAPSPFAEQSRWRTPAEAGGVTQTIYVVLEDVDGHASQAAEAGADIFMAPADQPYGGRNYCCRDPEGNVWCFGSYDPVAPA